MFIFGSYLSTPLRFRSHACVRKLCMSREREGERLGGQQCLCVPECVQHVRTLPSNCDDGSAVDRHASAHMCVFLFQANKCVCVCVCTSARWSKRPSKVTSHLAHPPHRVCFFLIRMYNRNQFDPSSVLNKHTPFVALSIAFSHKMRYLIYRKQSHIVW